MVRASVAVAARFLRRIVWYISCIPRATIRHILPREVPRVVVTITLGTEWGSRGGFWCGAQTSIVRILHLRINGSSRTA